MKKLKFALLTAIIIFSSTFMMQIVSANPETLDTPDNLVLNRGHIESLAFGGPMGLSWAEVEGRETFTVFAFTDINEYNPDEAYLYIDDIDALYLNVNTAFSDDLADGPFWFRVQAVSGTLSSSVLSEPIGPFWYAAQSDEFADNPEGSLAIFDNEEIPVIVIDTRRPIEREEQGNVVGDVHVIWPNALAVEDGVTHMDFQVGVLEAWQNFIENHLTDEQRENLDPALEYRDIHMFVY